MPRALTFKADTLQVNRLMLILDEFRKGYPGMTVDQAMTLLWVAKEPESTQIELSEKAQITKSAINRHVEVLGRERTNAIGNKVGAGLIANDDDDVDRRKKVLRLTPAGERIVKSIIALMSK